MATDTTNGSTSPKSRSFWMTKRAWLAVICLYACAAYCVRSVDEDKQSHAVRMSLPLLFGYSWIVQPGKNYDPLKADWGATDNGVGVLDNQVVFIRTEKSDYALKISHQTLEPEQATYEFVIIGEKGSIHQGTVKDFDSISLPNLVIRWSGAKVGAGFLYTSDLVAFGTKAPFQFGGPFRTGDILQFQNALPSGVQFSAQAWELNQLNGIKFDDHGFMQ